jgi:hypothetical protein
MHGTVVRLVRLAFAAAGCAGLSACVDPHADYDDFKARPVAEPLHDAAAPDVALTACETLLQKNPSGKYVVGCLPVVIPTPFFLLIQQDITTPGGKAQLKTSFKLLDINGTSTSQTVSDTIDVPATPIHDDCTYDLDIGDLTIPEKATTLGGDAMAQNVKLHALLQTEDLACAELDGEVVTPIPLSLDKPGDFCLFRRAPADGTFQKPDISEYACALPSGEH